MRKIDVFTSRDVHPRNIEHVFFRSLDVVLLLARYRHLWFCRSRYLIDLGGPKSSLLTLWGPVLFSCTFLKYNDTSLWIIICFDMGKWSLEFLFMGRNDLRRPSSSLVADKLCAILLFGISKYLLSCGRKIIYNLRIIFLKRKLIGVKLLCKEKII